MDPNTILRYSNFILIVVLQILGALFALWLASGVVLDQLLDIEPSAGSENEKPSRQLTMSRPIALVLWFAMSGLFFMPIRDISTGIYYGILLGYRWDALLQSPTMNSWGAMPQAYYVLFLVVLLVTIYVVVLIAGRKFLSGSSFAFIPSGTLSGIERLFTLLGVAGLIYFLVSTVMLAAAGMILPTTLTQPDGGALEYSIPIIIIALVLVALVIWMSFAISSRKAELLDEYEDEPEEQQEPSTDDQVTEGISEPDEDQATKDISEPDEEQGTEDSSEPDKDPTPMEDSDEQEEE